ncbi:transposase, partial [Streptococcus suis]
MSHPIIPLTVPQSRRFEKRGRNDIMMKIRLGKVELTVFHTINQETLETILDKVLFYD